MSTNPQDDWDQAAEAARPPSLPDYLRQALLAHLTKDDHLYDGERLRVGADLKPEGEVCDRAIYYRLKKTAADPPQLARRLRYERGRLAQRIFADALRGAGAKVVDEVACRALRPTAWAWDAGHGDVLDEHARHLYEVKAPGIDAWRRARGMPQKLVCEAYRFQLSYYLHELRRTGQAETASWVFFDLEGEFDPVELHLTDDFLVPLSQITAIEEEKSRLMWATEPPARPRNTVEVVKVLKGGRKTKKNPSPARQVHAVERRFWSCRFCDFVGTCQPGPEEVSISLSDTDPIRLAAVARAEVEWAAEDAEKKARKDENETTEAPPSTPPPLPPQTRSPAAAGPPPAAEPPPSPAAVLHVGTSATGSSGPACSCGFSKGLASGHEAGCPRGVWTDDRTKEEKRVAASDLAASVAEIDDRAARGVATFPQQVENADWGDAAPGVGW